MKRLGWLLASMATLSTFAAADEVSYRKQFGDWTAVITANAMTDEQVCGALYSKDNSIVYTSRDSFKVNMRGKGGASFFRYRFGKSVPSHGETVTDDENSVISVPVFISEVLTLPNLVVTGETVTREPISINISLKGLSAARAALQQRCTGMVALPSMQELPDWAWQATPSKPKQ